MFLSADRMMMIFIKIAYVALMRCHYAGDASHTAWRSNENRLATWQKPTRRYICSVLKLLFHYIIVIILHFIHFKYILQFDTLLNCKLTTVFLLWIDWSVLFLPVGPSSGAERSASTDQQRSPSAVNRPRRSNSLHLFARKVS